MKNLTIELQSGKQKVKVPQSWDEIDLQTFIRIETEFKYDFSKLITLFSIMTGIDMAPLEQSEQKNLDLQLFTLFQFISKPPEWESLDKPKKLVIEGKSIECKYDFKATTLGQKLTLDQLIRDKPNAIEAMPEAIGVFLQPTIDRKFSTKKMKALLPGILKLNCKDAFSYAQFFFLHSKHLKRYGLNGWAGTPRKRHITPSWQQIPASCLSLQ